MGVPGTGVVDLFELLCSCWESNLEPLEEQTVLLMSGASLPAKDYELLESRELVPFFISVFSLACYSIWYIVISGCCDYETNRCIYAAYIHGWT